MNTKTGAVKLFNVPGIVGDSDSVVFGLSSTMGSLGLLFVVLAVKLTFLTGGAEYTTFFASITDAVVWVDMGVEDIGRDTGGPGYMAL